MITDILRDNCRLHKTMWAVAVLFTFLFSLLTFVSCARMGMPDGGWYDERPPRVVAASPAEHGTNVKAKKMTIYFDEFIKMDNATEKVVVSPPQMEMPEIKSTGKHISISLKDSLKPNTTYTIDFSDAISDNNEGNPMGSYTYTFSTGDAIDTLEVSGTVLDAQNLEPVKGILVGLYEALPPQQSAKLPGIPEALDSPENPGTPDSVNPADKGAAQPFLRVARTDSRGHFIIRGVASGNYTVGALMDMDGDYSFTQLSEQMAFSHDVITPTAFMDTRKDTIWADAVHIKDITTSKFIHYTPDNVVLRAFNHELTERHFLKVERAEEDHFTLFFTAPLMPDSLLAFKKRNDDAIAQAMRQVPAIRALNFEGRDAFVIEPSVKGDTITYWLRDTAVVNMDTLNVEMITLQTDTAGVLQMTTDTLEILAKTPYAKRLKEKQKEEDAFQKRLERRKKRLAEGETLSANDTIMPPVRLKPKFKFEQSMIPNGSIRITFPAPMQRVEMDSVHLYVEQDSLWYRAPFVMQPVINSEMSEDPDISGIPGLSGASTLSREWEIYTDWIPGAEYSFEIDTLAFEDIYGKTTEPFKTGIKVRELSEFASLFVEVTYPGDDVVVVQLLDQGDKAVATEVANEKTAEFYYLNPGNYYMRAFIDRNRNGRWDTGNYALDEQPEEVYYYPGVIECKAKWDVTKAWNLTALPLTMQKPAAIIKQKVEAAKQIQQRNVMRAAEKGVEIPARYR